MKTIMKSYAALLLFFCAVFLFGAAALPGQWKGTISEKNGVTTVKNPKKPIHAGQVLKLTEELRVGSSEGKPEYVLGAVEGIAVDGKGNLYIADKKNFHIQVFDDKGVYLRTVGREGQGPGEIGSLYDVFINTKGEVLVPDGKRYLLHVYSPTGAFVRDVSFGGIFPMQSALGADDGLFVLNFGGSHETGTYFELVRLNTDLKPISVVDRIDIPPGPLRFSLGDKIPVFFPRTDGRFVVGYSRPDEYRFEIRESGGKTLKIVTRDFDPVPIPRELIEKAKQARSGNIQTDLPTTYPPHFRIVADEQGRTFLCRPSQDMESKIYSWDVFDGDGRYLAVIGLPGSSRLLHNMNNCLLWKNGKLYTVEEDEEGYHTVKRYKAEWTLGK